MIGSCAKDDHAQPTLVRTLKKFCGLSMDGTAGLLYELGFASSKITRCGGGTSWTYPTKSAVRSAVRSAAEQAKKDKDDIFVCIIEAHGSIQTDRRNAFGVEDGSVAMADLYSIVNKEIPTKPKLFWVNMCRNQQLGDGSTVSDEVQSDHTMVVFSTSADTGALVHLFGQNQSFFTIQY